ncbi:MULTISPECIES: riboflavin biosynthesis protein RibF [unclassified Lentimonas]|uniref:riboflavin biosynthesis protein RibF n=1 Tax=unclassified Lentimonas TaxID=2630993 RepID=UPI0013247CB3|nr:MULTISPECIES: riboflavin biosynthesis protein RibF [unclassified Lentimonas]CAA6679968.1 Riboflavin kinase (EC / FMN adenylyltransferase (EC [Lentimonas sp. CC4]CAA6686524.1 Riboflavin kinase (EC / FMN adenylyltransferase (EC [Lentimonas sp. CC6]CAA7074800.1 Riboflavin kinase (EC / FMN adenylyltransferase (EC [Lentimonas sp. CC4]CAA7169427.1 Riboflavin kinase (EC / FMN adenylyltransferase (EC [Lentimonas sp. CC21]CAA7180182.1 Riboflavin kinase (EC / FMN adenylyltransferase (EC [Lentimonas s
MQLPAHVERFEELAGLTGELHLAIGVFDGVHLGHKAVIESAVFSAQRSGGVSGVLTFDPHPSRLFRPDAPTLLMMPIEAKTAMLHAVGVDIVIQKHFDRAFASIPAEDFLANLKAALPALKSIYIGSNFRFGKKRAGDVATLVESGNQLGLGVFSVDRIKHNGDPISSTRIRKELGSGRIEAVNALFGYNYFSIGKVVSGAQLGRTIGFPTLNLPWSPESLPRFGVYQVRFRSAADQPWAFAVANYGVKPTVAEADQTPALEVHALGDTTLDQGDSIEVEWLRFIRPEQKFESLDALKVQISKDCETARALSDC